MGDESILPPSRANDDVGDGGEDIDNARGLSRSDMSISEATMAEAGIFALAAVLTAVLATVAIGLVVIEMSTTNAVAAASHTHTQSHNSIQIPGFASSHSSSMSDKIRT